MNKISLPEPQSQLLMTGQFLQLLPVENNCTKNFMKFKFMVVSVQLNPVGGWLEAHQVIWAWDHWFQLLVGIPRPQKTQSCISFLTLAKLLNPALWIFFSKFRQRRCSVKGVQESARASAPSLRPPTARRRGMEATVLKIPSSRSSRSTRKKDEAC